MVSVVALLTGAAATGGAVTLFGVTLASGAGLTLAGVALNAAAGLALNRALQPSRPKPPSPEDVQQNFRAEVAPRLVHIGKTKGGGALVLVRQEGSDLYRLIVQGHRDP